MTRRLFGCFGTRDAWSRIRSPLRDAVVWGPGGLWLAVLLAASVLPSTAAQARDLDEPVRLNPALGDTLSADELQRFGLYGELEKAEQAVFLLAPWGGYLARLHERTDKGMVWRERNIPSNTWLAWQQRAADILAGKPWSRTSAATLLPAPGAPPPGGFAAPETTTLAPAAGVPPAGPPRETGMPQSPSTLPEGPPSEVGGAPAAVPAPADTGEVRLEPAPGRVRVWPEVPLPPVQPRRRAPVDTARARYQELGGRWYLILEAGYKHDVTDFREFFTDQGMFGVSWGRMFGRLMPFFGMEIGFGDLQDDFEKLAGNGRGNTYNFELGLLIRQPLGRRTQFYVSGAYGYFIRSMQWGGLFYDPYYGSYSNGYVLEQQDWGVGLRAGIQLQRRDRRKARFWDLGLSVHTSPAQTWHYFEDAAHPFEAGGHDTWVTLSLRFGEGL